MESLGNEREKERDRKHGGQSGCPTCDQPRFDFWQFIWSQALPEVNPKYWYGPPKKKEIKLECVEPDRT